MLRLGSSRNPCSVSSSFRLNLYASHLIHASNLPSEEHSRARRRISISSDLNCYAGGFSTHPCRQSGKREG